MAELAPVAQHVTTGAALRRAALVGFGGATLAVVLLWLGNQIVHWLIWGTGYTDLPGQDTLGLVLSLEPIGLGVIALVVGRVCGLTCTSHTWLAALVSVLPLLLLTLVSPRQFWYWYLLAPLLSTFAAYPPRWRRRMRP
jgi:hypothetical protein